VFGGVILTNVLIVLNRRRALVLVPFGCLVLNTLLNLCLIPRFGMVAAAGTTVATEAVSFVVLAVVAARCGAVRVPVSFYARLTITSLAGALAIVDGARFGLFLQLLGFLVIFGCVAGSLGIVRRSDLQGGIAFVKERLGLSVDESPSRPAFAFNWIAVDLIGPRLAVAMRTLRSRAGPRPGRWGPPERYGGAGRRLMRVLDAGRSLGPPLRPAGQLSPALRAA
jgi:hypothetical protein